MQPERRKYLDGFKPRPAFRRSDHLAEAKGLPPTSAPRPATAAPVPSKAQAPIVTTPKTKPLRSGATALSVPRPQRQPQPQAATPQRPAPQPRRRTFEPPNPPKQKRRWWRALLFPAAILFCLFASFLVQSQPLGIGAIVIYGIVAWFKRIPSRYSFVMAFTSLATVLVLLLTRPTIDLATNFSTYTFLLLVVGVISAVREQQTYPKRRNSKIPHLPGWKRPW